MIDRETIIERSVEKFLRDELFTTRGYPASKITLLDAYPDNKRMSQALDKNYVAVGYQADDGGKQAELGSALRRRLYTLDFYVFAISRVWGKNLANVIRFSLESQITIPLLDLADDSVVGAVEVEYASSQPAVRPDPRPWEENAWITRIRVEDFYSSAQGG